MFKKWDIIIIVFLICVSFIPQIVFGVVMGKSYNNTYAQITIEGKLYKNIPLSEHRGTDQFKIVTKYGYNLIEVKDQSIAAIDADCPDKIDVKTGFVSKPGQSIICLPHKLMIEIKSTTDKNNDNEVIPAH